MRVIKVLIAASGELRTEVLEFTNLIEHLNKVLRPRGIELKRVKWNSDEYTDDYQEKLKDCQFCLKLYWQTLCEHSNDELNIAYEFLKKGENPRNLYVFFKEPAQNISEELRDFKANFVTNYGHFYCKFENVDTMNLHFVLQFEDLQNQMDSDLILIKEGNVFVGGELIANLDKIPFAALNKEYQRLKNELSSLDNQIIELKKQFSEDSSNYDLLGELVSLSGKRERVFEDFEKHQHYLFNIALSFAKKSRDLYSERLQKARLLFERGEASEADDILNMEVMKQEAVSELAMFEHYWKNLEIKIEEFRMKAKTVMANTAIQGEERINNACHAYLESICIAEKIRLTNVLAEIKFEYACFLQKYDRIKSALIKFEETRDLYKVLTRKNKSLRKNEASSLVHIGQLKSVLQDFNDAESSFLDALNIYRELSAEDYQYYKSKIAYTLCDLARLYQSMDRLFDAKKANDEALSIWEELSETNYELYHPEIARTLARSLKFVPQRELTYRRFKMVEDVCLKELEWWKKRAKNHPCSSRYILNVLRHTITLHINMSKFHEALEECLWEIRIREKLAKDSVGAYNSELVYAYEKTAVIYDRLNQPNNAECYYKKAIELWKKIIRTSPEYTQMLIATYKNLSIIHINQMKYEEADYEKKEVLFLWKQLYLNDSNNNRNGYIDSLKDIAEFHYAIHKYEEGKSEFQELISLMTDVKDDGQLIELAKIWWDYGIINYEHNLYENAKKGYLESLSIYLKLQEEDAKGLLKSKIVKLRKELANLHQRQDLYDQAEKELSEPKHGKN